MSYETWSLLFQSQQGCWEIVVPEVSHEMRTWEKKDKLKLTNKHLLALLRSQSKQSYLVLYSGCNFKSWCDGQTDEMNYKYLNIEMRGDVNITVLKWSSFIREFHYMMNCLISGISSLQTSQPGQHTSLLTNISPIFDTLNPSQVCTGYHSKTHLASTLRYIRCPQ